MTDAAITTPTSANFSPLFNFAVISNAPDEKRPCRFKAAGSYYILIDVIIN